MSFELARKVADAVLYEGYVLYPYRASAVKNQVRWQFGVIVPRGYAQIDTSESSSMQTECLIESNGDAVLDIRVRFLQVQARTVEEAVDGQREMFRPVETLEVEARTITAWDEGIEQEIEEIGIRLVPGMAELNIPFEGPGGGDVELVRDAVGAVRGRIVRTRWSISGVVNIAVEQVDSLVKIRVLIENVSAWPPSAESELRRNIALRQSLIGAHTILVIRDGAFVSLLDPPESARHASATCVNLRTWPVLIGEPALRTVMLSSPIILYDYPAVAPESPGDLYDATEIDEILTLRTMTLTEDEKREARGTDERAAAILDRVDTLPSATLDRLHGAVRQLSDTPDSLRVNGVLVSRGSRVRLKPGLRRTDAQDMFLMNRLGIVEKVMFDVENGEYLAVTLEDDPAADLHRSSGRFFYFSPDEVEPLDGETANDKQIEAGELRDD